VNKTKKLKLPRRLFSFQTMPDVAVSVRAGFLRSSSSHSLYDAIKPSAQHLAVKPA